MDVYIERINAPLERLVKASFLSVTVRKRIAKSI